MIFLHNIVLARDMDRVGLGLDGHGVFDDRSGVGHAVARVDGDARGWAFGLWRCPECLTMAEL